MDTKNCIMNNSIKSNRERVLNLKEIGWLLAEQWKALVCIALIVMMLFLGLMHWRYNNQLSAITSQQGESLKKTASDIIGQLPENEQESVSAAYDLNQRVKASEKYLCKSPLMKMDPYHARRFKTDWIIAKASGQEAALAEAYMLYIDSDEFCQGLLSCFREDADIEVVRESVVYELIGGETKGAFSCKIYLHDGIDEEALQKEFPSVMEAAHKRINAEAGGHQIRCLDQTISESKDQSLIDSQRQAYERVSVLTNQLKAKTDVFTSEQKGIYENLISAEKGEINTTKVNNSISIRNILIGLILGVILYVGCLILYVIISDRVFSGDALEEIGLYKLGSWYQDRPKKGLAALFNDRRVYRLHHKNHFDKDKEVQGASKKLVDSLDTSDKRLLFTLTVHPEEKQKECCDELIRSLDSKGYTCDTVLVDDQHGVFDDYAVSDIAGVVLMVADAKTKYQFISQIIDQCNYYGTPVFGSFYMG